MGSTHLELMLWTDNCYDLSAHGHDCIRAQSMALVSLCSALCYANKRRVVDFELALSADAQKNLLFVVVAAHHLHKLHPHGSHCRQQCTL